MSELNRLQIQRLVDGELGRQQIRQLLLTAESDPGLYRQIALAMVEDRILQQELNHPEGIAWAGRVGAGSGVPATPQGSSLESGSPVRLRSGGAGLWGRGASFLAMAAALLVMTWVGYRAGQQRSMQSGLPGELLAQQSPPLIQPEAEAGAMDRPGPGPSPLESYAPYRMQMVSNEGQASEEIPVMPISMAREMGLKYEPSPVPQEIQSQFNRRGYRVQPEIQYIHGRLPDGRELVVPFQKNRVTPWGQ